MVMRVVAWGMKRIVDMENGKMGARDAYRDLSVNTENGSRVV